ncbi:MAG: hypothetical protein LBK27_07710 [Treponema sp.]|jgi:hypothetical protein|nr:hypothetical protein [Treponema sp.]
MNSGENPVPLVSGLSFDMVLDRTCSRLWERKIQYSMRQIQDMEERLAGLERELDGMAALWNQDGTD